MTRRARVVLVCGLLAAAAASAAPQAQDVTLEYRVKAAYLFNFTKFVEWPEGALPNGAPLTICVAGSSPFGPALEAIIRGEMVGGRPLTARAGRGVEGCHVLFVPQRVAAGPYLRAAASRPILTVGESDDFLSRGGMVNFVLEGGRVRFEIDPDSAARAGLRVSSHLLRLARPAGATEQS